MTDIVSNVGAPSAEPVARPLTLILNRQARRLSDRSPVREAIERGRHVLGTRLDVVETRSLAELDAVMDELAREPPETVLVAGGDGSYMASLSSLVTAFAKRGRSEEALPAIGLLPGGTVSTVARNWGFHGGGLFANADRDAARYVTRFLEELASGRTVVTRRPTLRVTTQEGGRVGFIAGAGLVSRFFEVYDAEGARGYGGAASIVARVFAGSFAQGALAKRILDPVRCTIEVDGAAAPFDRTSLLCASVVRDLGLGMKLLYRAGESLERFHVVSSSLGPARLGPQLPLVRMGLPLVGTRVDALANEVTLRFPPGEGAYVLDGELLRSDAVSITAGPIIRVVGLRSDRP
ncbi:DAG-kinase catalytic domain protein [Labilithrix luteola]|uniref:DAG-kinase catalytic domain protein n=1 Tax=Labilithrix luteola TaxID=1391654 RepID=A0A0K1QGE3_9BACT|nr:diacylglycerol kinase family protein [Labilithrix luteola]AKV04839.1 DAG-kinase catalytic domain protein [Labilithrix luteola]